MAKGYETATRESAGDLLGGGAKLVLGLLLLLLLLLLVVDGVDAFEGPLFWDSSCLARCRAVQSSCTMGFLNRLTDTAEEGIIVGVGSEDAFVCVAPLILLLLLLLGLVVLVAKSRDANECRSRCSCSRGIGTSPLSSLLLILILILILPVVELLRTQRRRRHASGVRNAVDMVLIQHKPEPATQCDTIDGAACRISHDGLVRSKISFRPDEISNICVENVTEHPHFGYTKSGRRLKVELTY